MRRESGYRFGVICLRLLTDLRAHFDDFRHDIHRQMVTSALRSFVLSLGFRQFVTARLTIDLRKEVLTAVAAENQLRLAAGGYFMPLHDDADGRFRIPIADHQRA